ncbi:type 2 lanthipeptide synthetase LanM family protein [Micromonospora echinospora]|uniref:type 2 lanthipeptide synthetase LanM family protein n=1 Tax=Micromonospora echinospora TaxID=1877 RepID=UPI0037ACCA9F
MTEVRVVKPGEDGEKPALSDTWWAPGLTLAERCSATLDRRPREEVSAWAENVSPRARERLRAWYDAHELGSSGQLAAWLADLHLTEDDLLVLLAEPPETLTARTSEPGWARFTAKVVDHARRRRQRVASDDRAGVPRRPPTLAAGAAGGPADPAWADDFGRVLAPYLDVSDDLFVRSAAAAGCVDLAAIRQELRTALSGRLIRVAARVLVLELSRLRSRRQLAGASRDERFADFICHLQEPAALQAILVRYPVLARLLAQICDQTVDATTELLHRLATDWAAIVGTFFAGVDPGHLVGIEVGAGDRHQRGRAVTLLRFATGVRLVYKPRPLAAHRHFNDLLCWLNAHQPGLGLRTLTVLDRPGYGWVEFVSAQPCDDRAAVERFYHRQGTLLALLYAFDGADIHYENLVACGDQPVLVDVETLFHPSCPIPGGIDDPAADALARSVYRSALLPQLLLGDDGALDISGLGGDKGGSLPVPVVDWQAAATDEMRLVRRLTVFAGAANRPHLDGADAEPADFAEPLLAGFRAGYETIARHRADLLRPGGIVQRFADDEVRFVVRATRVYLTLLDESTHPDVLHDALDRDRLLGALWAGSAEDGTRLRLVRHEFDELWHGDVPIFTLRPGERHLWTGAGVKVADILDETPLNRVRDKLERMTAVDRYDQEWIIHAALATRRSHQGHVTGGPIPQPFAATAPDPDRLLAAARAVADQIVARGFDDGNRINWLGMELLDERHWTVMPLGVGLGSGYGGTALFLAQLAAVTADARYATVARRALQPVPHLVERLSTPELARAVGGGGYAGFGGIAYALAQVSVLLRDTQVADWIEPVVRLAGEAIDGDSEFGVHEGAAGCLAAMLAVHATTGLESAWHVAVRCADRLLANPGGRLPAPGFAFGAAGIGWALLRFSAVADDPRYAARGQDYLRHPAELNRVSGHSWCQGWPGVGLALLDVADMTPDPRTGAVIARSIEAVVTSGPLPNHSLCHGELGRLELLGVAARTGHAARATYIRHAGMMLSAIERFGPRCGTPDGVPNPGLLNGLAGIGHGLLRLGFPDRVPSVLLLEPPNHELRMP